MLDWKQKKMKRSCTDWLGRETEQGKMHMRLLKDKNSNVMVSLEAVLKRWMEYFEKLMKENDRDFRTEEAKVVNEEVNWFSREEVTNALKRMRKGKAVGPDELPVEVWKCMGEIGIKFLTRLFNTLLVGEQMPKA